jgi:hypothetical protein
MSIPHHPELSRRPGGAAFAVIALPAIFGLMFVQKFALETKGRLLEETQRKSSESAEAL